MFAILDFFIFVINKIVLVLSFRPFSDFPFTYFQFLMTIVVIRYLFTFLFGGTRDFTLLMHSGAFSLASSSMLHLNRKEQLVKNSPKMVGNKNSVPSWLGKDISAKAPSEEAKAKLRAMLDEFDG